MLLSHEAYVLQENIETNIIHSFDTLQYVHFIDSKSMHLLHTYTIMAIALSMFS